MIDLPPQSALIANTPRLRLVPLSPDDAEEMFAVLNDQRLHRFTGGLPLGEAELREQYRAWQVRRSVDGSQVWLNWVVRLVPLGEAIGHVQATVTDDNRAVIGYVIGTQWSRHGFAVEASTSMIGMLHAHVGVRRLEAHIHPRHIASHRVAQRLGLRRTGRRDSAGEEVWAGRASPGRRRPLPPVLAVSGRRRAPAL